MDVCLIDVDSKIPNLALMKLSTWHKSKGDTVKLGYDPLLDNPDICYVSKVFDFTPEPEYLPDCEIVRGGPAYDLKSRLPMPDADRVMPDYGLYREMYPDFDYAIGRFTRGCPNRCPWCVVPKMDGNRVHRVAELTDFWCGQERVRLLDDNIMADAGIFEECCAELAEVRPKDHPNRKVKVLWEALDIRLVNDRTAAALAMVTIDKTLHFAWDGPSQDRFIERGIETLRRHGIKPYRLMFYVLVGFNTTPKYDLHRIMTLRDLGANPYVMPYDKSDPYQHYISRFVNNKWVFKKTPTFDDYKQWRDVRDTLPVWGVPAHDPVR